MANKPALSIQDVYLYCAKCAEVQLHECTKVSDNRKDYEGRCVECGFPREYNTRISSQDVGIGDNNYYHQERKYYRPTVINLRNQFGAGSKME